MPVATSITQCYCFDKKQVALNLNQPSNKPPPPPAAPRPRRLTAAKEQHKVSQKQSPIQRNPRKYRARSGSPFSAELRRALPDAQNAKQVWERLAKAFEDSGLTRKVGLLKELINTNLENSLSVEDYVNKIMTAAHKLRNINFHVDDEWLGTLMLAGLSEVYRPMIMGLESSGMKISADLVKNKLLQEVKRASMHMTMHREWLTDVTPSSVPTIRIANNKLLKVECCGNVCIKVKTKDGSTDSIQVTYWAEAVATAAYIVNRSPTCTLSDATPHEVWTGKKPNLSHMRIFGCSAMVLIPKQNRTKLDVKSHDSDQFENVNDETYIPDESLDSPVVPNLRPLQQRRRRRNDDVNQSPSSLMCQNVESTMNLLNNDPQSLQEALHSEKADEWKRAMHEEYQSLIKNNTWTQVDLPEGKSVIPSRWVLKLRWMEMGLLLVIKRGW
ncbi:uncharacterized protein LOC128198607 [Bicyclus anynana]|uniref:Uncharacterized protein LOC128198607 n=1 Tax=Bicyclus anynana TaxID=110368 RepID=A0ABM3LP37_BICAN|nr:uncharacterized protein LOC128198607 [Bicyclus anynana]